MLSFESGIGAALESIPRTNDGTRLATKAASVLVTTHDPQTNRPSLSPLLGARI